MECAKSLCEQSTFLARTEPIIFEANVVISQQALLCVEKYFQQGQKLLEAGGQLSGDYSTK
jgi:hypothetical protein